jgi:hypothetical protein
VSDVTYTYDSLTQASVSCVIDRRYKDIGGTENWVFLSLLLTHSYTIRTNLRRPSTSSSTVELVMKNVRIKTAACY